MANNITKPFPQAFPVLLAYTRAHWEVDQSQPKSRGSESPKSVGECWCWLVVRRGGREEEEGEGEGSREGEGGREREVERGRRGGRRGRVGSWVVGWVGVCGRVCGGGGGADGVCDVRVCSCTSTRVHLKNGAEPMHWPLRCDGCGCGGGSDGELE